MRSFRPCFIASWLYPGALFRVKTTEKLLYLTFDDGPDPESTERLLDILGRYNIKAIFFCNGRNAEKYPGLVNLIKSNGHQIGNHGYSHFDGWKTSERKYEADTIKADTYTSSSLFRPPYGHLRFRQYLRLRKRYKIVFWDLMPYDFDSSFGPDNSLRVLKKKIRPGSVIVLHDTQNSTVCKFLEEFIKFALSEGYSFESI
jgi:peptidoglycan-N-acetylglucosamine deacetylase